LGILWKWSSTNLSAALSPKGSIVLNSKNQESWSLGRSLLGGGTARVRRQVLDWGKCKSMVELKKEALRLDVNWI
jgi:hypothetical protein